MGMTMTQKILAKHAGLDSVVEGQLIRAKLDMVLGNDITSPVAINEFQKNGFDSVFDRTKISLVMDHFTPNKDIKAAKQCQQCRSFADKYDIKNYRDVGQMGIEHALLPEQGLVGPGCLCIGADSHTCTYGALGAFSTGVGSTDMAAGMISGKAWFKVPAAIKFNLVGKPQGFVSGKDVILHIIGMIGVDGALYKSMEFTGEGVQYLNIDDRLCIANMAIEAGAKNGIFPVDDITREYCNGRYQGTPVEYTADEDAVYDEEYTIDLSTLRPTVAFPHLPENTKTVEEYIDVFYNYAIKGLGNDVDLIKQSLGVAQDVPEILGVDADKKFFTDLVDAGCIEDVQIAVKESLKRQFSGKTLEEIKATAKTKEDLASKNIAKVLFEEFWDSDKKEFINSNDAYVEAFKKAAKSIQGKTALIFGAVGAAVLGLGTYLCIGGKKEK